MQDTGSVRTSDQLDWKRLAAYLRERLPACGLGAPDPMGELEVAQFHGGHSNLTYLVRFGDAELVLRRPPVGPLPPSAHDMAREYRWLAALCPILPLVPRPYLFCDDLDVIGSPFYVMERRYGVVVRQEEPPALADRPDRRQRVSEALVDALADLHAIDLHTNGLSGLGKPSGFVARQVRGWTERWHRSQTTAVSEIDAIVAWLVERVPPDPAAPSIVHGDFKLDNVMLDAAEIAHIVAIFDWEMSALGDPLIDVGVLLAYWGPTGPPEGNIGKSVPGPFTERPGWLRREEIVERYAARSRRDVAHMLFYEIFALFKVAVILQQIFYRYSRGETTDSRFARFDERVAFLAQRAAARIEHA